MTATAQIALETFGIHAISDDDANDLLERWRHPLGALNRPFGRHDWALLLDGEPIALACSASTVSASITDEQDRRFTRFELVELARLARHPDHPYVLRPMLRLWRAYLGPRWERDQWRPLAAISYALPGTPGDLYRFDGWTRVREVKRSMGGGTWTKKDPKVAQIGDGVKSLWIWRYPA